MGLTSWVVTTERVSGGSDGMVDYGAYLINSNHKNHKNKTHQIVPMIGDLNKLLNSSFAECTRVNMENTKGGRPIASYLHSFVLSLPPLYKPTPEQWKKVATEVCLEVCKKFDLPKEKFADFLFTNVHQQDSNDHLNLVVSRAYNGRVLLDLDRKSTLAMVKKTFTSAVLKHCAFDVKNYVPMQPVRKRKNRGRVPKWAYRLDQLRKLELTEQEIKLAKDNFAKLIESANAWVAAQKAQNQAEIAQQEVHFVDSFNALHAMQKEGLNRRIEEIRKTAEESAKVKFKM